LEVDVGFDWTSIEKVRFEYFGYAVDGSFESLTLKGFGSYFVLGLKWERLRLKAYLWKKFCQA